TPRIQEVLDPLARRHLAAAVLALDGALRPGVVRLFLALGQVVQAILQRVLHGARGYRPRRTRLSYANLELGGPPLRPVAWSGAAFGSSARSCACTRARLPSASRGPPSTPRPPSCRAT